MASYDAGNWEWEHAENAGSRCSSLLGSREAEGTQDELILGLYLTEGLTVSFSPVTVVDPYVRTPGRQPAYLHISTTTAMYGDLAGRRKQETKTVGVCQWKTYSSVIV